MRQPLRVIPLTVLVALLLAGCDGPPPAPPPTSTVAPRFASDEEALAAAEAVYAEYKESSDQIIRDGGTDPERLKPYMTDEMFADELEGMKRLASTGWRGVGHTRFTIKLQRYSRETLTAYVCDDLSQTDLIDTAGNSVVDTDRQTLLPFEVEFRLADPIVIADKALYGGSGVC